MMLVLYQIFFFCYWIVRFILLCAILIFWYINSVLIFEKIFRLSTGQPWSQLLVVWNYFLVVRMENDKQNMINCISCCCHSEQTLILNFVCLPVIFFFLFQWWQFTTFSQHQFWRGFLWRTFLFIKWTIQLYIKFTGSLDKLKKRKWWSNAIFTCLGQQGQISVLTSFCSDVSIFRHVCMRLGLELD